jgi:hypothetical protein
MSRGRVTSLYLRLSEEEWEAFRAAAKQRGRSASAVITNFIRSYLSEQPEGGVVGESPAEAGVPESQEGA